MEALFVTPENLARAGVTKEDVADALRQAADTLDGGSNKVNAQVEEARTLIEAAVEILRR